MQYRTDPITIKGAAVLPTADSTAPAPTRSAAEFHRPIVRDHPWRSVATTALLVMGVHDSLRIAKQYFFPHLSMWQSHGATIVLSTGAAVWVYRPTARRIRAAHAIEAVVENAFDAVVTADERARIVTWKRKAIAAGCDAHLNKPIKKLILLEAMRNATALPRAPCRYRRMARTRTAPTQTARPRRHASRGHLPASPFSSGCSTSSRRPRARCSEFSAAYPSP